MHVPLRFSVIALALSLLASRSAHAYWIRDCKTTPSDWTSSTEMVADINPGAASVMHPFFGFASEHGQLIEFQNTLYFQADDGAHGSELWRVGAGQPQLVADIASGSASSSPHAFALFQGRLYFAARSAEGRDALYRVDGAGAALVSDAGPAGEAGIDALTVHGNALYFVRHVGVTSQLWRYDGNSAQPVVVGGALINDVNVDSLAARALVSLNGRLYYVTSKAADYRLWAYDGQSTTFIKALTFPGNPTTYTFDLGVFNGALYFGSVVSAEVPFQADQLWRYSGSGAPVKVATFEHHAVSTSQPRNFIVYHGALYFSVSDTFYRYDGSTLSELPAGSGGMTYYPEEISSYPAADRLYFRGFADDWKNSEPYLFDGTTTTIVRDIMPADGTPYPGSFPSRAVAVGDMLYFYANDAVHGRELWGVRPNARVPQLKCDIVVVPIWTDWREWIVRERDVLVATWMVAPGEAPRLIARERATARPDRELRLPVLQGDTQRLRLPAGASLLTRVYDLKTGAVLDSGEAAIGAKPLGRTARLPARGGFTDWSMRRVLDAEVRGL